MTLYIVKNERNEEVSAYTDIQRAMYLAEQLQSEFFQDYRVEELSSESENEVELV